MWGRPAHFGWEDTQRGDLWFQRPRLERKTVGASQLLATLRFDTCPVMWQNLQTGCSLHKLTVHNSARGHGAEQPEQQSQRPMEATENHLEEDCTSLEPAGQATLENKPFLRPKALILWVKLLCIVEMTTESYSHVRTNSSWHQGMSAQRLHIHNHTFTTTHSLRAPSLTHVFLWAVLLLCKEIISKYEYMCRKISVCIHVGATLWKKKWNNLPHFLFGIVAYLWMQWFAE